MYGSIYFGSNRFNIEFIVEIKIMQTIFTWNYDLRIVDDRPKPIT